MIPRPHTVCRFCLAACLLPALAYAQAQPVFSERVEVSSVLIDARVVDDGGKPVLGLDVDDFLVKIGGQTTQVQSVGWVPGTVEAPTEVVLEPTASAMPVQPIDRLIVILIEKSLDQQRIRGLMRMLIELRAFVEQFTPDDRIAVLSFDTQLKVWLDFTNDLDDIRWALEHRILFERPGPVQEVSPPSLLAGLDPARARRAASIEKALGLVGQALEPLPGSKSVVLVGHGFGNLTRMGVTMPREYRRTSEMLQQARVSVFCLDITEADYHSLEAGLADDTGGFFARTHIFAARPLARLAGALAGHYVLFVEIPELSRGTHRIEVNLTRAKGTVLARNAFESRAGNEQAAEHGRPERGMKNGQWKREAGIWNSACGRCTVFNADWKVRWLISRTTI